MSLEIMTTPIILAVELVPNPVTTGGSLIIKVSLEEATHSRLTRHTHAALSQYTHAQLGREQLL